MQHSIDFDKTKILSQTKDSLIIQTEELLNALHFLQSVGRRIIDIIDDNIHNGFYVERYIVCLGKGLFYKKASQS